MTYQPREFWDRRLAEHFDLRGTGQPGLSEAYNRACYALRRAVLERVLRDQGFDPRGRRVLDVGCGTGFFTAYYLARGAQVTGWDIAPTSIERLQARHPEARFALVDVSEATPEGRYDLVNAFDVLYHVTDDARWERAVRTLAAAVEPGGWLLLTDTFPPAGAPLPEAEHNRMRPIERYRELLEPAGLEIRALRPTHVLLNRELGPFRFMNRAPGLLYATDLVLLGLGLGRDPAVSKLLVARRAG
jgi:SAM-dependent methyltransferase